MLAPHPPLNDYYGDASKREGFVRTIFDDTAPWYDQTISFMSFGSGDRYRREAVLRNGLQAGMKMLDVASGTGVVARAALGATKNGIDLVSLDPSAGMLLAGRSKQRLRVVQGTAELLPVASESFDFLTIGFALDKFRMRRSGLHAHCFDQSSINFQELSLFARIMLDRLRDVRAAAVRHLQRRTAIFVDAGKDDSSFVDE